MVTIQQNSNQLVIKQNIKHNNTGSIIIGFIFSSVFLPPFLLLPLSMIFSIRHHTLNCKRIEPTQVTCQIQETITVINQTRETNSINLIGVETISREESDEDGTYTVYQIQLISKTESLNFGNSRRDKAEIGEISQQIKSFLADSNRNSLQVTQKNFVFFISVSVFLLIWYSSLIFSLISNISRFLSVSLVETWDFDRKLQKLILTKKLVFNRQRKFEYSLVGKSHLELEEIKFSNYNIVYQFYLVLDSGEKLTLNSEPHLPPYNSSYFSKDKDELEKIFKTIGEFMNWNQEIVQENKKIRCKTS
ncbi:MAG TPA: hypothetical protein VK184_20645 [Nostocaceae cyanobacterium]|nr:hypothetical protein [Nostocaceae cyanobacterium]